MIIVQYKIDTNVLMTNGRCFKTNIVNIQPLYHCKFILRHPSIFWLNVILLNTCGLNLKIGGKSFNLNDTSIILVLGQEIQIFVLSDVFCK